MTGSHELWLDVANRILGDSPRGTMIDVCCGACAVTRKLGFSEVAACDILPRNPEVPEQWLFSQSEALAFLDLLTPKSADLVICSDGLEHMRHGRGLRLLKEMARVGRTALIFTPTGDVTYDFTATNPHTHKSSWTSGDFHNLGWETLDFPNWHPTLGWGAVFAWKK